jgi:hypothetical protein
MQNSNVAIPNHTAFVIPNCAAGNLLCRAALGNDNVDHHSPVVRYS